MSNIVQQLTDLRESLRSMDPTDGDSFSQVFGTFLDLNEHDGLMDVCKTCKDKGIRELIELVARRHHHDPELAVTGMQMLHHVPTGLFHGAFFAGRNVGTFFYFVKALQGLVALCDGTTTHYYRITAGELPPGTVIGRKRWTKH